MRTGLDDRADLAVQLLTVQSEIEALIAELSAEGAAPGALNTARSQLDIVQALGNRIALASPSEATSLCSEIAGSLAAVKTAVGAARAAGSPRSRLLCLPPILAEGQGFSHW